MASMGSAMQKYGPLASTLRRNVLNICNNGITRLLFNQRTHFGLLNSIPAIHA